MTAQRKGLYGLWAGFMFSVKAGTLIQGLRSEPGTPPTAGLSEMNGLGAAANRSLLLSRKFWLFGAEMTLGELPKGFVVVLDVSPLGETPE